VHAEDTICLGVRQHFDEALCIASPQRTAIGHERYLTGLVGNAFGFELLLGLADPGDFRIGVDNPGDEVEADVASLAGHQFGNGHALFHGFVRQHRATHHITNCPDARQIGFAVSIDFNHAALVEL